MKILKTETEKTHATELYLYLQLPGLAAYMNKITNHIKVKLELR